MKAVVVAGANDLRIDEIDEPHAGPGQVRVAMEWGGICGSDLSYWKHGASGTAIIREPLVVGHEVAGRIDEIGEGVEGLEVGQAVTIHPATLVGDYTMPDNLRGRDNLWPEVRYFGSAAFFPHEQGGFSAYRVARADQIRVLPDNLTTRQGAVAEPLGVAIHAVHRAGDVTGKRILVNGAGPIGALVVAAAKHAGARNLWLNFAYAGPNLIGLHARDDGRGAVRAEAGNGLSGMRERLQEFGGSLVIDTGPGQGFALTLRLPLDEHPALAHAPTRFEPPALDVS